MRVLVTGAAGFIGSRVAELLVARGDEVVGLDNLNDYYDPALKEARLKRIAESCGSSFSFERVELADRNAMADLFATKHINRVVHLAAQAGGRHSLDAPFDYIDSNITGFLTVLEGCRHYDIEHLVYASTSSVFGANTKVPYDVRDAADHPLALYGATKRANELMAHSYSHLFDIPTTGLRFFTVYGPWGRPDMALFDFTKKMLAGEPINVFNYGNHSRDFTYIDDIAAGVVAALDAPPSADTDWDSDHPSSHTSKAPWRVHNIGNERPVKLMRYIELLEEALGVKAEMNLLPMQPGDVPDTWADVSTLTIATGYKPATPVETGVQNFVEWYRRYYRV